MDAMEARHAKAHEGLYMEIPYPIKANDVGNEAQATARIEESFIFEGQ